MEECSCWIFAKSPCFFRSLIALAWLFPATSGTVVKPGPFETYSFTVECLSIR